MITAILLAAGQSKRLKYENKLIKIYKNKPLINHSLETLVKSKINKIIIVLGYQSKIVKQIIKNNKKISFTINKKYKKGMSSSIKCGLKKVSNKDTGFIIVQSDMPHLKCSDVNKICNSIKQGKKLVHALVFNNKVGNPIGFNNKLKKKFSNLKGKYGAKFMVKRLTKETNFIRVSSELRFKDFDKKSDFRA